MAANLGNQVKCCFGFIPGWPFDRCLSNLLLLVVFHILIFKVVFSTHLLSNLIPPHLPLCKYYSFGIIKLASRAGLWHQKFSSNHYNSQSIYINLEQVLVFTSIILLNHSDSGNKNEVLHKIILIKAWIMRFWVSHGLYIPSVYLPPASEQPV